MEAYRYQENLDVDLYMIIAQLDSREELGENVQFDVPASMLITREVELGKMFGKDGLSVIPTGVGPVV